MVSSLTRIISVIALLDWQQFNVFISLQCEQGEGRRRGMKGVGAGRCQKTFFFQANFGSYTMAASPDSAGDPGHCWKCGSKGEKPYWCPTLKLFRRDRVVGCWKSEVGFWGFYF